MHCACVQTDAVGTIGLQHTVPWSVYTMQEIVQFMIITSVMCVTCSCIARAMTSFTAIFTICRCVCVWQVLAAAVT